MPSGNGSQYYKQNRLQQLRGFCYAAKAQSVSKAAEQLFLSQPSVSLQIQALEREFKATLFERRGPKISLTPDGQKLFELASPLVDEIDALAETFAAERGGIERGQLDIAAGESTTLYLLPRFVKEFSEKYPGIDLFIKNLSNARHIRPPVTGYTQLSVAVGKAIETSLLGRGSPKDTLAQAAKTADKALS